MGICWIDKVAEVLNIEGKWNEIVIGQKPQVTYLLSSSEKNDDVNIINVDPLPREDITS